MGKYDKIKKDYNTKGDLESYDIFKVIANELAEANRLKRLEMKTLRITHGLNVIELEDHA